MNSRERVLATLNHSEPDGIPVDLGAHRSSGISAIACHRLRKHLGEVKVQLHNILANVPPQNNVAVLEAIHH